VSAGNTYSVLTNNNTISVRWLNENDPHYFDVYNRPIADLTYRQLILSKSIDDLGVQTGVRNTYPFLNQPILDSGTGINLPTSWIWDMRVTISDTYQNLRLAILQRYPTSNNIIRLVFTGDTESSTTEVGLFYVDYEIDSILSYQIRRASRVTSDEHPNPVIPNTLEGYVTLRTVDQDEYSEFFNALIPPVTSTPIDYEVQDSPPGGLSVDGDFSNSALVHGTGLLSVSSYVSLNDFETIIDDIDMNGNKIVNLGDATADTDALNRGYADDRYVNNTGDTITGDLTFDYGAGVKGTQDDSVVKNIAELIKDGTHKINVGDGTIDLILQGTNLEHYNGSNTADVITSRGGTFTDTIDMDGNEILGVGNATTPSSAINKLYADNNYVNVGGDQMIGDLDMSNNLIRNVANPGTDDAAMSRLYADGRYLAISGGTMAGDLDMDSNEIKNVGDPTSGDAGMSRDYADVRYLAISGGTMSGDLDMDSNEIKNVGDPTSGDAGMSRDYADTRYLNVSGDSMSGDLFLGSNELYDGALSTDVVWSARNNFSSKASLPTPTYNGIVSALTENLDASYSDIIELIRQRTGISAGVNLLEDDKFYHIYTTFDYTTDTQFSPGWEFSSINNNEAAAGPSKTANGMEVELDGSNDFKTVLSTYVRRQLQAYTTDAVDRGLLMSFAVNIGCDRDINVRASIIGNGSELGYVEIPIASNSLVNETYAISFEVDVVSWTPTTQREIRLTISNPNISPSSVNLVVCGTWFGTGFPPGLPGSHLSSFCISRFRTESMQTNLDMNSFEIKNIADPTTGDAGMSRDYADTRYLNATGDAVSGDLSFADADIILTGTSKITGVSVSPSGSTEAASKGYVDFEILNASGYAFRRTVYGYRTAGDINLSGSSVLSGDVVYNVEVSDNQNDYDNATGIWTCPATGLYHIKAFVHVLIDIGNDRATTLDLNIVKNAGSTVAFGTTKFGNNHDDHDYSGRVTAETYTDLTTADTIKFQYYYTPSNSSSCTIYAAGIPPSNGFLIERIN
jgi:hypothetical protein